MNTRPTPDAQEEQEREEARKRKEARLRQALQKGFDDIAAGRVTTVKVGKELSDFLASL